MRHDYLFIRSIILVQLPSLNHVLLSLTSCLRIVISLAATIGSIPEVPAESCNEVKTSEKGRDGKYWLSSIIPATPVFAYCDMKTGGKLKKGNLKSCSIVENGAAGGRVLAHLVLVLQSSLPCSSCYGCCSSSSSVSSS